MHVHLEEAILNKNDMSLFSSITMLSVVIRTLTLLLKEQTTAHWTQTVTAFLIFRYLHNLLASYNIYKIINQYNNIYGYLLSMSFHYHKKDVNPTLYDGDKSSRGCVGASYSCVIYYYVYFFSQILTMYLLSISLCLAALPSTGDCPGLTDSGILWPSTPPCDYSIQRCTRKIDKLNATGMYSLHEVTPNVHDIYIGDDLK